MSAAVPSPTINGLSAQQQPLRSALKNEDDVDRPCPSSGSLKGLPLATVLLAAGLKRRPLLRTRLRTTMAIATGIVVSIIVRNYSPRSEIG
ncbi:hypothetical protein LB505_001332 [Fusarium chuoi]|nr:hypothetical protein LB505_001332 [Fusarium chuoi]